MIGPRARGRRRIIGPALAIRARVGSRVDVDGRLGVIVDVVGPVRHADFTEPGYGAVRLDAGGEVLIRPGESWRVVSTAPPGWRPPTEAHADTFMPGGRLS